MTDELARGAVHEITAGPYTARITEVGATLDALELDGRALILSSPPGGPMLFYRGAIVAPWPNRIADGAYTYDGENLQAPINEVERHTALHGLVSFQRYTPVTENGDEGGEDTGNALTLETELYPQTGYPFHLHLQVRYVLDAQTGLTTTVRARNLGTRTLPYGVCPHPYLVAGTEPMADWSLRLDAGTVLEVTEDRLLPTGTSPVEGGSAYDFAAGKVIGAQQIDTALTDLARDGGIASVRVTSPSGTGVEISFDERCPWVQLHTGDRPGEPENDRLGLAVEPMTCPPDAFRSGTDVVHLAAGDAHEASWQITGF
ncbi:MAG: aldose 1-epimerase family protein [Brachybacterium sp.]|nr:aldose 1-epimerase family protein [Brachybacterium sp.]